jgi:hypothetical protein
MANQSTVHGNAAGFQVETNTNSNFLSAHTRTNAKLTAAGRVAALGVLNTYYSGLSAAQLATLPDVWCRVDAAEVFAAVAPGTAATLAASLLTVLGTAGNAA